MRLVVLAALAATAVSASVVTPDQISVDVGVPELVNNVLAPGSVIWRIPVIVSARLTNTGSEAVVLNGVGGGSALFPPTQIQPDGTIAPGSFVDGPMFAADIAAYLNDGPYLSDQQVIDGVSGSGYGIYALDGTPIENDWLIPPAGYPSGPPVSVRWSTPIPVQNDFDPVSSPEPATFALCAFGLAAACGFVRRRAA